MLMGGFNYYDIYVPAGPEIMLDQSSVSGIHSFATEEASFNGREPVYNIFVSAPSFHISLSIVPSRKGIGRQNRSS